MAPNYQQLLQMSDDELIAAHDKVAQSTQLGVNYYLEELRRRAAAKETARIVAMTEEIRRLTFLVAGLTALNTAFVIASFLQAG